MENSEEIRKTPTIVRLEGGNNRKSRIGGSAFSVSHQDETGKTASILCDCGALFAPEGTDADVFIANILKYATIDENALKKAFPNDEERNRIREKLKQLSIGTKKVDALFITHMHEDHIGGLTALLQYGIKFPKIYTSESTAAMIDCLCYEKSAPVPEIQKVKPYETIKINDHFEVSAIPVSHSTIGPYAFYMRVKYMSKDVGILNMGDYNLEKTPLGEGFEESKFREFMKGKPVNIVMVDSTSASFGSKTLQHPVTHEKAVENIRSIMQKHPDRYIISPVISRSIENHYNLLEAARLEGKNAFLDGYMLRRAIAVAGKLGVLDAYKDVIFGANDVINTSGQLFCKQVAPGKGVILQSGASGEGKILPGEDSTKLKKKSSFVKLVEGTHSDFPKEILSKSVLLLTQRIIPVGTVPEKMKLLVAEAAKAGAIVYQTTATNPEHSFGDFEELDFQRTGHIVEEEMIHFFNILDDVCSNEKSKRIVVSVHGDDKQLAATGHIAKEAGLECLIPFNKSTMYVDDDYVGLVDNNQNDIVWLGISEIADEFGNPAYSELCTYVEHFRPNGEVTYKKLETIATAVAKAPKTTSHSSEYASSKTLDKVKKYEEDTPKHAPMRMRGSGRRQGRRGGR